MARELLARGLPITFIARGASMRPFLRDGDVVAVHPDPAAVRTGDLVLLAQGELGVVHRVLVRLGGWVCVKGDALPRVDGWFAVHELLGRVVAVTRRGRPVRLHRWRALAASLVLGAGRRLLRRRL